MRDGRSDPPGEGTRAGAGSGASPEDCDPHGRRFTYPKVDEVSSAGFDPWRQLNPDGFGTSSSSALWVPSLAATTFRFLLVVVDLAPGDAIVGIRQDLELVELIASGVERDAAPFYPLRQTITNPLWHLPDGGDTWTLTREGKAEPQRLQGPWDQDSFRLRDADGSALVYETAAFAGPLFPPGYGSLTAYTAPAMRGTKVLSVRDRRWSPWNRSQANERIHYEAQTVERWRLYCDVRQGDPSTRSVPAITGSATWMPPPEEGFLQTYATAIYGWVSAVVFVRRGKRG